MKPGILLILLCATINCLAQNSIRIVVSSGNVFINGSAVLSGQLIQDENTKLVIAHDKVSYAYVVTAQGRHAKLAGGSYRASTIDNTIDSLTKKQNKRSPIEGAICRLPYPVVYEGMTEDSQHIYKIMGDSIYLRWDKNPHFGNKKEPLDGFRITNMFGDPLYKLNSPEKSLVKDLIPLFESEANLYVQLDDAHAFTIKKLHSDTIAIIESELSLATGEQTIKRVLDLIVYDCNGMLLDVLFHLNKKPIDTSILPDDLRNYIAVLKNRFRIQ
jgi:hypothetical protein